VCNRAVGTCAIFVHTRLRSGQDFGRRNHRETRASSALLSRFYEAIALVGRPVQDHHAADRSRFTPDRLVPMLYKEWPSTVRLKQEGRYWFIVRVVEWRNREVDDVLEVAVDREKLVAALLEMGYREADCVWIRNDSPTHPGDPRLPGLSTPSRSLRAKQRRDSGGSNAIPNRPALMTRRCAAGGPFHTPERKT
jgi:hypothetical protein